MEQVAAIAQDDRFYFFGTLAGYNLGLTVVMVILQVTGQPQPALIWILPSMTVFYLVLGYLRRELWSMAWYDEDKTMSGVNIKFQ